MSETNTIPSEPVRLVIFDYDGTLGSLQAQMLFEGIKQAVETLRDRGITLAILSRGPDRRVLKAEGLLSAFSKITIGKSLKDVQAILASTGADPQQTVYLGDSQEDMEIAKRAGVHPIGVSWEDAGNSSVEISRLRGAGAERVLTDPSQIVAAVLEILELPADAPPKPKPAPQPKGPWWRFGL